ncbi:GNAT family N-acetyltransferase [Deinococcus detaillensis]|uniref:GNAT family N-acetyltransferase n=1 Tax=Deinococcus detaillensis TaxID=2592048 RepID=A0A553V2K5_9DEIO|nr:GNAT family protein [Deinococcus detaillensis]TSA86471.1 GNAT family N-acetyltransferase [Deinococcus detaillensis]
MQPAAPPDWLKAPTLTNRFVRLEALTAAHAPDLAKHATDATVSFLSRGGPTANTPPAWAEYIERLNALPSRVNFAVLLSTLQGQQVAGRISYSETKPSDLWLEIGTMLTPPFQGSAANPAAKLLLMERAFGVLGANRVQFKVDGRNARSLKALEKLGAVREGTLRQFQVQPDGYVRDSVMFSILSSEWPGVRERLTKRLEALQTQPLS